VLVFYAILTAPLYISHPHISICFYMSVKHCMMIITFLITTTTTIIIIIIIIITIIFKV